MKANRVNVRRPEVMDQVTAQVTKHYTSTLISHIKEQGGEITIGNTRILLAREFGFCYGVQRAIDLAYSARSVFPTQNIYLIGEIIHNPEVNRNLLAMGIKKITWGKLSDVEEEYNKLQSDDVVIIPAFGASTEIMNKLQERGVSIVDTTCGDVMKVWRRIGNYAKENITSLIHGKASHEETVATSSKALGDGSGKFLIILTKEDCQYVCDYITGKHTDKNSFLTRFKGAYSQGFNPDTDLKKIGIANQTTMLKSETEDIQESVRQAIIQRDGNDNALTVFDTICGATQNRQNSLFSLLKQPLDYMIVVGGYNSSNTTHLVEIAEKSVPTFFIEQASCLTNKEELNQYNIHSKTIETISTLNLFRSDIPLTIGITAGASCPANLIEETLHRILELRGLPLPLEK